jgi:hypothetical protein
MTRIFLLIFRDWGKFENHAGIRYEKLLSGLSVDYLKLILWKVI